MAPRIGVLFHGVPGTTEAQLTGGPDSGKVWIISAMYAVNTTSSPATLTLAHRVSSTNRYLLSEVEVPANKTIAIGPLVLESGQSLRAAQGTSNAIEIMAYGYEDDA